MICEKPALYTVGPQQNIRSTRLVRATLRSLLKQKFQNSIKMATVLAPYRTCMHACMPTPVREHNWWCTQAPASRAIVSNNDMKCDLCFQLSVVITELPLYAPPESYMRAGRTYVLFEVLPYQDLTALKMKHVNPITVPSSYRCSILHMGHNPVSCVTITACRVPSSFRRTAMVLNAYSSSFTYEQGTQCYDKLLVTESSAKADSFVQG